MWRLRRGNHACMDHLIWQHLKEFNIKFAWKAELQCSSDGQVAVTGRQYGVGWTMKVETSVHTSRLTHKICEKLHHLMKWFPERKKSTCATRARCWPCWETRWAAVCVRIRAFLITCNKSGLRVKWMKCEQCACLWISQPPYLECYFHVSQKFGSIGRWPLEACEAMHTAPSCRREVPRTAEVMSQFWLYYCKNSWWDGVN